MRTTAIEWKVQDMGYHALSHTVRISGFLQEKPLHLFDSTYIWTRIYMRFALLLLRIKQLRSSYDQVKIHITKPEMMRRLLIIQWDLVTKMRELKKLLEKNPDDEGFGRRIINRMHEAVVMEINRLEDDIESLALALDPTLESDINKTTQRIKEQVAQRIPPWRGVLEKI